MAVVEGHNIPALLTETQGYGYATPHHYKVSEFPEAHRELMVLIARLADMAYR